MGSILLLLDFSETNKGIDIMKESRLQLIKQAACKVAKERLSFKGLERQAVMLSDKEYVITDKKVVDSVEVLDFN